ncbi:MAG TPA: winged helix-turn-helix domain-containing protein [Nitrososphaeraceae archaeon]|nr:winged helix-turn-helix domain-containing protein [Nitrososphaeraceae archaeon]
MSASALSYRDKIYIIQDIILKLIEHGELNKTELIGFCGLNLKKHRHILDQLQINGLVYVIQSSVGKRRSSTYKPTQRGIEFCRTILDPYEKMFPRTRCRITAPNSGNIDNKHDTNKEDSQSVIDMSLFIKCQYINGLT